MIWKKNVFFSLARNRATDPLLFRLYPSLFIDYHIPAPTQIDLGKSSRAISRVKIKLQNQYFGDLPVSVIRVRRCSKSI